jgi:hypothetical protein
MLSILAISFVCVSASHAQATQAIEVVQTTMQATSGDGLTTIGYVARIVLADGSHARAACVTLAEGCGEIESFSPERMKPEDRSCTLRSVEDLHEFTCVNKNLGTYKATREVNDLLIKVPKGVVRYHIEGSW